MVKAVRDGKKRDRRSAGRWGHPTGGGCLDGGEEPYSTYGKRPTRTTEQFGEM